MNFQNDRPDPESEEEANSRIEWLAGAAGRELWDHYKSADWEADRRVIDFLRHIATTCRRTANYLENHETEAHNQKRG